MLSRRPPSAVGLLKLARTTPRGRKVFGKPELNSIGRRNLSFTSAVDTCCLAAHDALLGLHSVTGLPWVATLPLAAILVRATFVLPLEVWSRRHRKKATLARPLISAWRPLIQKRIYEENVQHGPNVTHKLYLQAMRAKRKEIYGRLSIRTAPAFAPLLQLPVFLVAIEAIRKMCGTREGLLGLATRSIASGEDSVPATDPTALSSITIEPSLAAEGALWFPDLLVPDPQLILPFTLSAALFLNVRLSQSQLTSEGIEPSKWSTRLSRITQLVALAIGPMTLSVPSAMLVYWISSSASAMLIHVALWKAMPHPPQQKAPEIKPK